MTPSESRLDDLIRCIDRVIAVASATGVPSAPLDVELSRQFVQAIRQTIAMEEADPVYSALFPERWAMLCERMDVALAMCEIRH